MQELEQQELILTILLHLAAVLCWDQARWSSALGRSISWYQVTIQRMTILLQFTLVCPLVPIMEMSQRLTRIKECGLVGSSLKSICFLSSCWTRGYWFWRYGYSLFISVLFCCCVVFFTVLQLLHCSWIHLVLCKYFFCLALLWGSELFTQLDYFILDSFAFLLSKKKSRKKVGAKVFQSGTSFYLLPFMLKLVELYYECHACFWRFPTTINLHSSGEALTPKAGHLIKWTLKTTMFFKNV